MSDVNEWSRAGVEATLREILCETLGFSWDEVNGDFRLELGHGNIDSLDVVELVMAAEDEFGVDIVDEEIEKLMTFAAAVELLCQKKGVK